MKTITFQVPHNQYFTEDNLIGKPITREGLKIGEVTAAKKVEHLPFWDLIGEVEDMPETPVTTSISIRTEESNAQ